VAKIEQSAEESKRKHIRGTGRVNAQVAFTVEWQEGEKTLQAAGYTVDVSVRGCMAVVNQGFPVGQRVRVVNSVNGNSVEATVIWRGHEGRNGWEMGLELDRGAGDFWGLEF